MGDTFKTAAAEAYDRHIGRYAPPLARSLMEAAGLEGGERVLDVGCGPGALTTELVARVGASRVVAIDPSRPFAEACRARHPGVEVHVGGAESLPFDDGEFGGAFAQLVVNFMADAPRGVREMARVTRPGGTVAAAVWDYGDGMTLLRRFWDAANALDPSCGEDESQMRYCTQDSLGELWRSVYDEVSVGSAVVSASYAGFEDLWSPLEAGVAPSGAYTVSLAPDARAALKAELRARLGVGEEPFSLPARAWIVTGRAPGSS